MYYDYLFNSKRSANFKKFLILILVTLALSACSTISPNNRVDNNLATSSSSITSSELAKNNKRIVIPSLKSSASTDKDFIADWAKERSEYLRSLDYEKIDRQANSPTEYSIKSNLVNTRFHLDYAERLLYVDGNISGAKVEINHAIKEYKKALAAAGENKSEEMKTVKNELRFLASKTRRVQPSYCDCPPRPRFRQVEDEIEELLVEL